MYIIKNALRCISRAKGRNILIGIIVLVIAFSSCIGLSIRKASETAKEETMEGLSVTAQISFDRQSMMQDFNPGERPEDGGGFDRDQFSQMMGQSQELTLEEYEKYAGADSVSDFYYTVTVALNGSDSLSPVSSDSSSDEDEAEDEEGGGMPDMGMGGFPGGGFGGQMMMGMDSDFTIEGVSSDRAMSSFKNGTAAISDGAVFDEGTEKLQCIVSEELALYNDIAVGDTIVFTNPNNEEETYSVEVTGIYTDSSSNSGSFSIMGSTSSDPANKVYMSAAAVNAITSSSEKNSTTLTDEDTGREYETALSSSTAATYVFADTESYEKFEAEARELGLSDSYTVSSQDINSFEQSLVPLETLSTMAGWFLLVILAIGAVILIVLNIFSIRERKYEIGVLCAMGMKKGKVALQFLCEIFAVTLAAVIVGALVGSVSSVPVTNALLANQIESQNREAENLTEGFGRGEMPDMGGGFGGMDMPDMGNAPSMPGGDKNPFGSFMESADNYVTEINSATDVTVLLQMLGIAILLTLVSGAVSMLIVMRYEPLKILANRD